MSYPMPLVIPKTRTVNVGGGEALRRTFNLSDDIRAQSIKDVQSMIIGITREQVGIQMRLQNPPQVAEVDNRTNKPLEEVKSKSVVLFGVALAAAAMRLVESELRQAINRSTRIRSGKLQDVGGAWQWRFVRKGGASSVVSSASGPPSFQRGDRLVLVPAHVPYATAVNRAVARSGRLNAHNAPKQRKNGKPAKQSKASQNLGFLATATRALRRNTVFKQFAVLVEFTKTHAVAGEVYAHGTGVITIRPRFKQVKV